MFHFDLAHDYTSHHSAFRTFVRYVHGMYENKSGQKRNVRCREIEPPTNLKQTRLNITNYHENT